MTTPQHDAFLAEIKPYLIKGANSPDDVTAHRQMSLEEEQALEAGKKRWLPRIFQSYGTPIPELMASPAKTGLIFGLPAGLLGAGLGAGIGGMMSGQKYSLPGAVIGGLGAGGLAALAAGMDREAKNEGLEELMRRMPEGAAKRDLLADPQYQADFLGWDNNKIVATARARYYRPTERFTKRTDDMRAARERYNERQKNSSINKDIAVKSEKQSNAEDDAIANSYAGNKSINVQSYSPQLGARKFSPDEQRAIQEGEERWLPDIFQNYGTPVTNMLASPNKSGLMWAVPGALGGAMLGNMLGGSNKGLGSALGALGGAGLAGALGYYHRQSENAGLKDLMRRLPEGATKRDLLSDSAYQADIDRKMQMQLALAGRRRGKYASDTTTTPTIIEGTVMNKNEKRAVWGTPVFGDPETTKQRQEIMSNFGRKLLTNYLGGGAGIGAGAGAIYGALTSKNKLKGLGRGALMGAGTGLGIAAGVPLGAAAGGRGGMAVGAPGWGIAAGSGAGGALGGGAGYGGGKLLADALIGQDDEEENKKAAQALLDNKELSLSEKMAQYKALLEKEAIGNPLAPAGRWLGENVLYPAAKGVYDTGAAINNSSAAETMRHLVGYGDRRSTLYDETAKRLGQLNDARLSAGRAIGENVLYPAAKGVSNAATAANNSGAAETLRQLVGWGDRRSTLYDETAKRLGQLNDARLATGRALGEGAYAAGKGVYDAAGSAANAIGGMFKSAPPPPPPSMLDQIRQSPWTPYALGGAAALGLGGLGYAAMNSGNKKKKRPVDEDGEVAYGKAAHSKQAMSPAIAAPIVSTLPNLIARGASLPTWAKVLGTLTAAGGTGAGIGSIGNYFTKKPAPTPGMLEQIMNYKYTPHIAAGLGGAGLLGGAALMGNNAGKSEAKKKRKNDGEKQSNLMNAGLGAGAGAGLGAAGGALFGALAPGQETDPETGRKKRRSRLVAALRGALAGGVGGGALGGAGGYALSKLNPELADSVVNKATMLVRGQKPYDLSTPAASPTMAGELPKAGPGVVTNKTLPADVSTSQLSEPKVPATMRGPNMQQNPLLTGGPDMTQNIAPSNPAPWQTTMANPPGMMQ